MAVGYGVPVPKGATRKQLKARKDRWAARITKSVRAQCVDRDGYCRLATLRPDDIRPWEPADFPCDGPSEWAHLGPKKRFKTRGQDPAVRHTTWGSFMGCRRHHAAYDRGRLAIRILTPFGADGPLQFARRP